MGDSAVVKASVYGGDVEATNVVPFAEDDRFYQQTGAVVPPYEPEALAVMFDRSSSLRPNVDALATNVEGFGHRLVSSIDLAAADADAKIRDSLLIEALFDGRPTDISADDVLARRRELEVVERVERLRTDVFLDGCYPDGSFVDLRARTRVDMEVTGNAYWEVLRDDSGAVAGLNYVPSVTMRLMRADRELTEVDVLRRISAVSFRRVRERRRFRRFVQLVRGQEVAYFREFGDPRVVSSRTGRIYPDMVSLRAGEGDAADSATEILHFKIHSPTSVYGVPRWIGATLAVLGTRDSEEVNLQYFRNKAVPPLAILVSGGLLSDGAADRISTYIRDQIKGKDNFHSILVLEAEPSGGGAITGAQGSRVRIEVKNLMDAQVNDALFQTYEANNALKVGAAFRIPKLLRGDAADVNRATSDAAIRYAEQQVFHPERQRVDAQVQRLLDTRGVRFVRFVSNSPVERDPPVLAEMAAKLVDAGILTPNEGRAIVSDALNDASIQSVEADWARIPVKAAQAGFAPAPTADEQEGEAGGDAPVKPDIKLAPTDAAIILTVNEGRGSLKVGPLVNQDGTPSPDGFLTLGQFRAKQESTGGLAAPAIEQQARRLVELRDHLQALEGKAAAAGLDDARRQDGERVLTVPREEWDTWFSSETE